jgi:hypothetical protein
MKCCEANIKVPDSTTNGKETARSPRHSLSWFVAPESLKDNLETLQSRFRKGSLVT